MDLHGRLRIDLEHCFSATPRFILGVVLQLSRRSRVGWGEVSKEGGRAGRGGGDRNPPPLPPLAEIADFVSRGEIPCYGRAVSRWVVRFPVVDA